MSQTMPSVLLPPDTVRGLTVLDKSKFIKEIAIPALKVKVCMMHGIMSIISPYLLKMEKMKPIQEADCPKGKLIYLNPDMIKDFNSFKRDVRTCLVEANITADNLISRDIVLTYDNWKAHDIIAAILPSDFNFTGFSIIGSIVHVNLRDELLPFRYVIGDVLLEKVAHCKSVVNKVGIIDNVYRNFEMEVLSGSNDTKTVVKENCCQFEMDFAHVYWNSRLHEEHSRIINLLSEGDVLYDVFCGIGPFAIPAAKRGCHVLANDLNPACHHWLNRNALINKVSNRMITFNKDGRTFIRQDLRTDYLARIADEKHTNSKFRITMNLPALADTFLSSFVNLFSAIELASVSEQSLPIVYLYCFFKNKTNFVAEAKELIARALHPSISEGISDERDVFHVRSVAPNKEMFRITFTLSKDVLSGACDLVESSYYPPVKKIKLDNTPNNSLDTSHSVEEMMDEDLT